MKKIQELLSQHENRRFDFFKDESGNVHMVDRTETKQGHFRMLYNADGTKDSGYVTKDEYKKIVDTYEKTGNFKAYEDFFKHDEKKKSEQDDDSDDSDDDEKDKGDDEEDDEEDDDE